MNLYLLVIIVIILLDWILDLFKYRAILSSLSPLVPDEFKDMVDAEEYRKNQNYTRKRVVFKKFKNYWGLLETVLILSLGLFGILNRFVTGFSDSIYIQGILFWAVFTVIETVIGIPWSIYETFVIEEEFGLNKTTPKTFVTDIIKQQLLFAVIGTPILMFMIYFFTNVALAWLWIWAGLTLFMLLSALLVQDLIMPLFNKFSPLDEGELKERIMSFAKEQNVKLKGIYKMDGSRRSTVGNAYFGGLGKSKRIVLYDTLIEQLSPDEIVAVLAHEIGHNKLKHIPKGIAMSIINILIMVGFVGIFIGEPQFYAVFGIEGSPVYAGLALVFYLFPPIMLVTSMLSSYFSRIHEYEADAFAKAKTGDAPALISGLKKLYLNAKSNLTPPRIEVVLKYSHPPILDRIKALKG